MTKMLSSSDVNFDDSSYSMQVLGMSLEIDTW